MEERKLKNEVFVYDAVGIGTIRRETQQQRGHEKSKMRRWEDVCQKTLVCAQSGSFMLFASLCCRSYYVTGDPEQRCDEPGARLVTVNQRRDAKRTGGSGICHPVKENMPDYSTRSDVYRR